MEKWKAKWRYGEHKWRNGVSGNGGETEMGLAAIFALAPK
ncbi:hypothetical protein CCACVL1_17875, partial [Corchorus capsularis]